MATLEIPIDPELIAERGYTAFLKSAQSMTTDKRRLRTWNEENLEHRNFWRAWAREFIRLNMGIGL